MLLPQFSIRRMLIAITGLSVVFLILAQAVGGQVWAMGAIVGLVSLVVISLVHGLTFFVVWLFASATAKRKADKAEKSVVLLMAISAGTIANGGSIVVPQNGKPSPTGLTVELDVNWPDGLGYRPLTITVRSTQPANADRLFSFEVGHDAGNPSDPQMTVEVDLELPAGATQAATTIAAPDLMFDEHGSLETWEDGRHLPSLSVRHLWSAMSFSDVTELMPSVLFVAATQPDTAEFNSLFPQQQPYYSNPSPTPPAFAPQWTCRAASALPDEWLCYQNLDLLFISLANLKSLNKPQLTAIRDWTRAGGNLMVFGVGKDWSGLASLEETLRCPRADRGQPWQAPDASLHSGPNRDKFSDVDWPADQSAQAATPGTTVAPAPATATAKITPAADAPFRFLPFQQGMIVALAPDDPFGKTFTSDTWYWVMNTLGGDRWIGAQRSGISYQSANPDFWMFLIPGVGGAPVNAYRVLITAFVILIGPVNYLVLRKHRRLHLLLFTVPASALLVTSGLLAYALVADGLHTRVRSRSFTMLDQRSGDAVSWSRLAYYSGLAPANGLRFARDVAVLPYSPISESYGRRPRRVFESEADHNQLSRGWLPSRTLVQLITARPFHTSEKLVVTEKDGALSVRNELGTAIQQVLVCGTDGQLGYGKDIASQQSQKLSAIAPPGSDGNPPSSSLEALHTALNDQLLTLPTGFDQHSGLGFFGYNSYVPHFYGNHLVVRQETSRLEQGLEAVKEAILQASGQAAQSSGSKALTPRSYIAITDRPEQVSLGLEEATETGSFHVIRGEY